MRNVGQVLNQAQAPDIKVKDEDDINGRLPPDFVPSLTPWPVDENKAGYTATPVACGWAGAVIEDTRWAGAVRPKTTKPLKK